MKGWISFVLFSTKHKSNCRNNPDNIALWKLLYKYEEAPTNATGPSVTGTGDDDSTVKVKKKKKVLKRLRGTYEVGKMPDNELRGNLNMEDIETYNLLNKIDVSTTVITPTQCYPYPTIEDYKLGSFARYFCVKVNQDIYLELDKETYKALVNRDPNYLWEPYNTFQLQWTLIGNQIEVFNTNRKLVILTQQKNKISGFGKFLKENYLKFYK